MELKLGGAAPCLEHPRGVSMGRCARWGDVVGARGAAGARSPSRCWPPLGLVLLVVVWGERGEGSSEPSRWLLQAEPSCLSFACAQK